MKHTVFHTSVYVGELICYICCSDLPNIIKELNKTVAVLTSTTTPMLPCSSPSAQPAVSDNLDGGSFVTCYVETYRGGTVWFILTDEVAIVACFRYI